MQTRVFVATCPEECGLLVLDLYVTIPPDHWAHKCTYSWHADIMKGPGFEDLPSDLVTHVTKYDATILVSFVVLDWEYEQLIRTHIAPRWLAFVNNEANENLMQEARQRYEDLISSFLAEAGV